MLSSFLLGIGLWFLIRFVLMGFYTVNQSERAVKTRFGRADRLGPSTLEDPLAQCLRPEERERYIDPHVRVIPPGGPYFKMPWEKIHKVSVATMTVNMALDLEDPQANGNGSYLEAATKDQLNTGLTGQIRYRVSDRNLYAFIFGTNRCGLSGWSVTRPPPWNDAAAPTRSAWFAAVRMVKGPPMQ